MDKKNYYQIVSENGFYTSANRLRFYLEEQLFPRYNFKGKSLIDIGGGNGLFGFYAAINGASKVVVMEPEFDGSRNNMINQFNQIKSLLGNPTNIVHTDKVLEDFDRNSTYDFILMHNSINHIDEDACIVLQSDQSAKEKYFEFFNLLEEISHNKTRLIVCDCSSNNFWNSLKIKNPFSPTIEWEKHQGPNFWSQLLSQNNYKPIKTSWNSINAFGKIGNLLTGNKLISFLTLSHFRLEMEYQGKLKNNALNPADTKSSTVE